MLGVNELVVLFGGAAVAVLARGSAEPQPDRTG